MQSRVASHLSPGLHPEPGNNAISPENTENHELAPQRPSVLQHIDVEDKLSTFSSALKETDLINSLNGTGPYTVFAPSDDAFSALSSDTTLQHLMAPENREQLRQLLSNHLVTGKLAITDLQDGTTLKTAGGQQLNVTKRNGKVLINDAALEATEDGSSNGVVHVLNKVLLPSS